MNKTKIFALIAAAMTFAACSTDNDITSTASNAGEGKAVTIASVTRSAEGGKVDMTLPFHLENTTLAGEGDEDFQADFVYTDGAYATADGSFVAWCNLRGEDGKRVDNVFQAFSPLRTKENRASFSDFFIPRDQSTPEKLQSADWMVADTTSKVDTDNGSIALNFKHQFKKLHFNITFKDDIPNLTSNSFKVINTYTPYYNSEDRTVEAIVLRYNVSQSEPLISIEIANGETISAYPPYTMDFEPGKQYNFNLAIGHDALTISSVSVTDWTSEPINMESSDAKSDQYDYVTFTAEGEQGFKFVVTSFPGNGITEEFPGFEYSVDNGEWISIPGTGMNDYVPFGGDRGTLRLRGKSFDNIGTSQIIPWESTPHARVTFENDVKVACSGDIRTLIDYENYASVETGNATFFRLFHKCTQLTSAPKLPATKLAAFCYGDMFSGCSSLKEAPGLPATELEHDCYSGMFEDCTSLTEAPVLPATKLAITCYNYMFSGCTSLTKAPVLPATTLEAHCYDYMFRNCSNLSEIKMLAHSYIEDYLTNYFTGWLDNAGTSAPSRTLILDSQDAYNGLDGFSLLPTEWRATNPGTMVVDKNGNAITDD